MNQQHSTMNLDPQSLINNELCKIKALAFSIISTERSRDELELLSDNDISFHVEELAGMILEQESKIRETLGNLEMNAPTGEVQIQQPIQTQ